MEIKRIPFIPLHGCMNQLKEDKAPTLLEDVKWTSYQLSIFGLIFLTPLGMEKKVTDNDKD